MRAGEHIEMKQEDVVTEYECSANISRMNSLKKENAWDRLCHSKLLLLEVKTRAEWQDMLNVSQIAWCSTSHCKWHRKDEEGLQNTACCMLEMSSGRQTEADFKNVAYLLIQCTAAFKHLQNVLFNRHFLQKMPRRRNDSSQGIKKTSNGHFTLTTPLQVARVIDTSVSLWCVW